MAPAISWRLATASCGAVVTAGHAGTPTHCDAPVTWTGLILRERPLEAWRAWSCTEHRGKLRAGRKLLDRDLPVLADWRERERRAVDGGGWDRPAPLAVGAQARELVRRAEEAGEG